MGKVYYKINEDKAKLAHSFVHMDSYKPNSKTSLYESYVNNIYGIVAKIKEVNPEQYDKALILADRYSRKMAEYINKDIEITLRCPSVLITGAAKFPVRKKEKQIKAYELNELNFKNLENLYNRINGFLYCKPSIRIGDKDAVQKLEKKLKNLEESQVLMKEVNRYYRKYKTLDGCPNLTEKMKDDIKKSMVYSYKDIPFLEYALANNNHMIRNVKLRIENLKKEKAAGDQCSENDYFKVVENKEIMRLQLFFDEKPSSEIRSILKGNAFKWSNKNTCWQRQLTNNARYSLRSVIKQIQQLNN